MSDRADWRSRRSLTFVAACAVAGVLAAAAALASGLVAGTSSAAKPVRAQAAKRAAARPSAVVASPDSAARTTANVTINLCAKEGSVTMPDGESVTVWGFALKGAAADCGDVTINSLPGPALNITQGDVVTLNVYNAIADHTISIEAPGIDFAPSLTQDAAFGLTATVSFTATAEGTYLYESSGDSGRQEAMGLYGALIVRPATLNTAYGQSFSGGDRVVVLSEIDPGLSNDPDGYDMRNWAPRY